MKRMIGVLSIVLACVAATAAADLTAYVNETGVSPYWTGNLYAPNFEGGVGGVQAGIYQFTITKVNPTDPTLPSWGFCIEMSFSGPNALYSVKALEYTPLQSGPEDEYGNPFPMGDTKANYIRELWYKHITYTDPITHTNDIATAKGAVAFQLAVWEIIYEDAQSWDVANRNESDQAHSFKATGFDAIGDAKTLANSWLGGLSSGYVLPADAKDLAGLTNDKQQDYVVEVGVDPGSVPVPGALLLGAIGLGVVAWLRKRLA